MSFCSLDRTSFLSVALSLAAFACMGGPGARDTVSANDSPARVELLVRAGCANSGEFEQVLEKALESSALTMTLVDQASMPEEDERRGYGTPTVLVNGADLFGQPRPARPFPAPT